MARNDNQAALVAAGQGQAPTHLPSACILQHPLTMAYVSRMRNLVGERTAQEELDYVGCLFLGTTAGAFSYSP
jgi:hypothetical protein